MYVTGPDCFRHYEMMLEGNIALVPDVYSIRRFTEGLPAFFFGGALVGSFFGAFFGVIVAAAVDDGSAHGLGCHGM